MLRSGSVRFVLKGAVSPDSPLVNHHASHGDGVVDISLEVPDVDKCIAQAKLAGATVLEEPHNLSDERGTVRVAVIAIYGETRHTLVQRAVTGRATPLRSARRSWCLPLSVNGTRPARVGSTAWPNCRASS